LRLIKKNFLTYGAGRAVSKVLAGFLWLASPAWADAPVTILAMGDSLTQGYGLPEAEGFVPQMQKWLTERAVEARLINGGVSGDTTAGGAARIEWSLTPDIDAMILTLGGNDLLRGLDPAMSRANIETILQVAKAQDVEVLLVGFEAPGNYGPEYKSAFDAIYPELSVTYETLYAESFFAGLGEDEPAMLQRYFQADAIHPNADGVARIVESLGPQVIALIARAK